MVLNFFNHRVIRIHIVWIKFYFYKIFSYTISGVDHKNFSKISKLKAQKNPSSLNVKKQLNELFHIVRYSFAAIALIYGILLLIIGELTLARPLTFMLSADKVKTGWYFLVVTNIIRIFLYPYQIIIQGLNKMPIYFLLGAFCNVLLLISNFAVIKFEPSIFNLCVSTSIITTSSAFFYYFYTKIKLKSKYLNFSTKINFSLLKNIWGGGMA